MPEADIIKGIVVGGAGGAIAGITVALSAYCHKKAVELWQKRRVYKWLKVNTSSTQGNQYRSTRAIASWNNMTEDRTRYICSIDDRIYLSTGTKEDMWSIYQRDHTEES